MVQQYSQRYCLAKYMKLYIAAYCYIKYERAAPSCGLLVYEQFYTVLKRLLTLAAEIPARWRLQHTFPDSGGTTFRRFLTKITLFWMVSAIFKLTNDKTSKHLKAHTAPRVGIGFSPSLLSKLLVTDFHRTYLASCWWRFSTAPSWQAVGDGFPPHLLGKLLVTVFHRTFSASCW